MYIIGCQSERPGNQILARDFLVNKKKIDGLRVRDWLDERTPVEQETIFLEIQKTIDTTFYTNIVGTFAMARVQEALRMYAGNKCAGKVILHPKMPS